MKFGILQVLACLAFAVSNLAIAAELPFAKYPAKSYQGPEALDLQFDKKSEKFKDRLEEAVEGPINFAGRYVFTSWPGPKGCWTGAAIDVASGVTTLFPFPVCQQGKTGASFQFCRNSRLMVTTGKLGKGGAVETRSFEFDGTTFKTVGHAEFFETLFGGGEDIEPAAGPQEALTPERAKEAEALKNLLTCYSDGTDYEFAQLDKNVDAFIEKKSHVKTEHFHRSPFSGGVVFGHRGQGVSGMQSGLYCP